MYIIVKSKVMKLKSKIRAIQDAFKDYNMKKGDEEFGMVFLRCVMRAQGGVLNVFYLPSDQFPLPLIARCVQ